MNTQTDTTLDESRGNVENTNKQDSLINYEIVEGTPFTIATTLHDKTEREENYILMGMYRINENPYLTKKEAEKEAKLINWDKILKVVGIIVNEITKNK